MYEQMIEEAWARLPDNEKTERNFKFLEESVSDFLNTMKEGIGN